MVAAAVERFEEFTEESTRVYQTIAILGSPCSQECRTGWRPPYLQASSNSLNITVAWMVCFLHDLLSQRGTLAALKSAFSSVDMPKGSSRHSLFIKGLLNWQPFGNFLQAQPAAFSYRPHTLVKR
jgi:hypothetical protein